MPDSSLHLPLQDRNKWEPAPPSSYIAEVGVTSRVSMSLLRPILFEISSAATVSACMQGLFSIGHKWQLARCVSAMDVYRRHVLGLSASQVSSDYLVHLVWRVLLSGQSIHCNKLPPNLHAVQAECGLTAQQVLEQPCRCPHATVGHRCAYSPSAGGLIQARSPHSKSVRVRRGVVHCLHMHCTFSDQVTRQLQLSVTLSSSSTAAVVLLAKKSTRMSVTNPATTHPLPCMHCSALFSIAA